ncbi:hypothetical protein ACIBCT_15085 [Streptosporangium sp. NPDC050855]|uniref:hypothetical protein n=1 Tax=Streptosporangium sp. NPDC050855 TaxID=3366194 RepID=UPI0037906E81
MSWIIVSVLVGLAGSAVLGVLALRVLRAGAALRREVDRTRGRLEPVRILSGDRTGEIRPPRG